MKASIFSALFTILTFNISPATGNPSVQVDNDMVNKWNQFVRNIYQLHIKQTKNKEINTSKRLGGYYRQPDFFKEIKFTDKNSNILISRIEWETRQPDKIHSIEVRVHDNNNKIIREYSASYLPDFRNAPYQTLINIHHYNDNIHSFRQYDASANLLYEVCRSGDTNKKLFEHDDYEIPDNFKQGVGSQADYKKCFQQLALSSAQNKPPH